MKAKAIFAVILAAAILGAAALVLPGCNALANRDNVAANRLDAEAALERAQADRARAAAEAETAMARAVADAEAQRARAQAEKAQAEADAYQKRVQADTSAAAERSALRQLERDAAHERTLELLPFVLLIVGVVAVGALAVMALVGKLQRKPEPDPILTFLLQQQNRRLQELERAAYHQIAMEQRRLLGVGSGPIVVYDGEGRVIGDE